MPPRTIPIRTSRTDPTVHHWTLGQLLDDLGLDPSMYRAPVPWRMEQVYRGVRFELSLYMGMFNVYVYARPSVPLEELQHNFLPEELPAARFQEHHEPVWIHEQLSTRRYRASLPARREPGPFTRSDAFVSWRYIVQEVRAFIDGLLRLRDAGLCTVQFSQE